MVTQVALDEGGVSIDGEFLGFPVMISRLEQCLGAPRRLRASASEAYIWDDAGIRAFTEGTAGFATYLEVFSTERPEGAPVGIPEHGFSGSVTSGGTEITRAEFRDGVAPGTRYAYLGSFMLRDFVDTASGSFVQLFIADGVTRHIPAPTFNPYGAGGERLVVSYTPPSSPQHTIDVSAAAITFDGQPMRFAVGVAQLDELLGTPRPPSGIGIGPRGYRVWDTQGIGATVQGGEVQGIDVLDILVTPEVTLPASVARTVVTINGRPALDADWVSANGARDHRRLTVGTYRVERWETPGQYSYWTVGPSFE